MIRSALMGLRNFLDPVYRHMGLTDSSYHVLYFLLSSKNEVASPSKLSDLVGMSRANMTKVLESLVKDGLITREVESRDARRAVIRATPEGRKIALDATLKTIEPLQMAFSGLTPEEQEMLDILLRKLIGTLDKSAQ